MTLRRIAVPAIVVWLADSLYGYLVFGVMLEPEFARFPNVFRSFNDVNSMMPLMLISSLLGFVAVTYIFAKGHEGGSGLKEGFWFGIVIASLFLFLVSIPSYVIYQIGRDLSLKMSLAGFGEMLIDGIVLGLVYKPAASAAGARRTVGV